MQWPVYVFRFLAGGALVCAFTVISQVVKPKRFAGIFSAAPSVLLAGLAVTLLSKGQSAATLTAEGAIAGAVGLIAYCLVSTPAIRRLKAIRGASVSLLAWLAVALCAFGALRVVVGL
jgi:hypothetical protein